MVKTSERARRDVQMLEIIRQGKLPYTAGVMSWLSDKLGKKASRIEAADIKKLVG